MSTIVPAFNNKGAGTVPPRTKACEAESSENPPANVPPLTLSTVS